METQAKSEPSVASVLSDPLTFVSNMSRPVHRWFRYSAGFSAEWAESVMREARKRGPIKVLDPFAGSGTTLISAETVGVESWGLEAHPFVCRIAKAKLAWHSEPDAYLEKVREVKRLAPCLKPTVDHFPDLITRCFDVRTLEHLDILRQACAAVRDDSPSSDLIWLTLLAILRKVSHAGTAQWQYILPKHTKLKPLEVQRAFEEMWRMVYADLLLGQSLAGPRATFLQGDARTCDGLASDFFDLVITSPPYPNNYDYADATRLEMSFLGEIEGWGDLQGAVRQYLVRSCSQHVPESAVSLDDTLAAPELSPIRDELSTVCRELAEIRLSKGGRKTYHLMVACYFRDLASVWIALRRVCKPSCRVCFVVGDSAPYGVYVPVVPWLGRVAVAAGFKSFSFRKTRDRNIKWKNRKHRVPLLEGELWVEG